MITVKRMSVDHFETGVSPHEFHSLYVCLYLVVPSTTDYLVYTAAIKKTIIDTFSAHLQQFNTDWCTAENFDGWYADRFDEFRHFFLKFNNAHTHSDDTFIIQTGLSSALPCAQAWPRLRQQLATLLEEWKLSLVDESLATTTLTYTLVYKSNIGAEHLLLREIDPEVFELAKPLFENEKFDSPARAQAIASYQNKEGAIVLCRVPQIIDPDPCTIYVVLCTLGTENSLFINQFYLDGKIMSLDKYNHKAFFQWKQIKDEPFRQFDLNVSSLADTTTNLLQSVASRHGNRAIKKTIERTATGMTYILVPFIAYKRLALSMEIQLKNIELLAGASPQAFSNDIYLYYQRRTAAQLDDCRLSLQKAEIIVEQTGSAIHLVEAQQSKDSNERAVKLQLELGVIGAALAFIQVFDNETATGLLRRFRFVPAHLLSNESMSWMIVFGTRLLFTAMLVIVILMVYRLVRRR